MSVPRYLLLITGLGMGLVFLAILMLWALMEIIVRTLADRQSAPAQSPAATAQATVTEAAASQAATVAASNAAQRERRARAAVAAVAALLAIEESRQPLPHTPLGSAWQDASRSAALNRMASYTRRQRTTITRQGPRDEDYR